MRIDGWTTEAVITAPPATFVVRPNEIAALLLNVSWVANCINPGADIYIPAFAVIVEPTNPNEMLPLTKFENVIADASTEFAPAEKLTAACAVIVEPANPNETLFEFENVTADRLLDVVPAEKLILPCAAPALAVMAEAPLNPNDTFPTFDNVTAD